MRMLTSIVFVAIGIAGCASQHAPASYGNFVAVPTQLDEQVMADDVARKMAVLYPPARSSIAMRQATPDVFGTTLTASLRGQGYALAEFDSGSRSTNQGKNALAQRSATGDLKVAYVVDQPLSTDLYRVTVFINDQSLSRFYQSKGGSLVPAGCWVRKE